jgi:hypothetical protein
MVIRSIVVAPGPYADTDWLDPAVTIPDNARLLRATGGEIQFAMRGRASSAPNAAIVSLGVMTVDAYVLRELEGGGTSRGKTIVEREAFPLPGQVTMVANDVVRGTICRLHLTLANVSAPVVEVLLLAGAVPL